MNALQHYSERHPLFVSLILSITFQPEVLAGSLTLAASESLIIYRDQANNEVLINVPAELKTANGYPTNDLSKII